MEWYYAAGDKQQGPVDEETFRRLVSEKVVKPQTLVWRKGIPDWIPYSEVGEAKPRVPVSEPVRETGLEPASEPGLESVSEQEQVEESEEVILKCYHCQESFELSDLIRLDGKNVCEGCKPALIQLMHEGGQDSDDERIRNEYLNHEASVRSVGPIYFIIAALFIASGLDLLKKGSAGGLLVLLIAAGLHGYAAVKIRKLDPSARPWVGVLSGLVLLVFPVGTVISAYILYLVFSKKGKFVMSEEYVAIMERTPGIRYRASKVIRVLLWIVLGLILMGAIGAILGAKG